MITHKKSWRVIDPKKHEEMLENSHQVKQPVTEHDEILLQGERGFQS